MQKIVYINLSKLQFIIPASFQNSFDDLVDLYLRIEIQTAQRKTMRKLCFKLWQQEKEQYM